MESIVFNDSITPIYGVLFQPNPNEAFGCSYSTFSWVHLEQSGELKVAFTHRTVTIKGKHLEGLPNEFLEHRVREVRVLPRAAILAQAQSNAPMVEEIVLGK